MMNVSVSAGLVLLHRLPCHIHQRQEVELMCPSQAMASLQEVQVQGHLGQGEWRRSNHIESHLGSYFWEDEHNVM